jgi:hypothetical protein
MPVLTTGRSIFAIVLMLQFSGISAGAANMPLPDRNPMRVPAIPLPERNSIREAGLPLPERNPNRVAPVTLISVGKDPEVRLVPPATVTCNMVAAMAEWIEKDVQPAARKILGAPITRMHIIGHYSCRQALGRTSTRLSEHGLANALDIRDFVTERGESADLTRDWGPTARDIAARVAAEAAAEAARKAAAAAAAEAARKAAKEAKDAAPKAAEKVAKLAAGTPEPSSAATISGNVAAEAAGRPLSRSEIRRARRDARRQARPNRLGHREIAADAGVSRPGATPATGKKPSAPRSASTAEDDKPSPRRQFLHQIHAEACRTFGTVLGPEANEAHRNHFHVDMAKRRHRNYCE